MAVSAADKITSTDDEAAIRAVAEAMRDAATTTSEISQNTADSKPPAGDVGTDALQWLSRLTYTGSYVLSYGVVYAAVFVAQALPQENPIMSGFRDGGREAMEQLDDG
ncbi:MAG: hypothetical protein JO282_08705 [Alphaproteobacteria bacterium]|nr:hypothetical protein [Alphaproteobacteria bacterium]